MSWGGTFGMSFEVRRTPPPPLGPRGWAALVACLLTLGALLWAARALAAFYFGPGVDLLVQGFYFFWELGGSP